MQHSTLPEQKLKTLTSKQTAANSIAAIVLLQALTRLECVNQIQHGKAGDRRPITNPTVKPDRRYKSCLSSRHLVNPCFCYASEQSIFTLATRYVYALVC